MDDQELLEAVASLVRPGGRGLVCGRVGHGVGHVCLTVSDGVELRTLRVEFSRRYGQLRNLFGGASAECRAPVDAAALREAERRLGRALPAQLDVLLRETDGVADAYGTDVVWPLAQIVEQNLVFWSGEAFAGLYMPFDSLLFFGDNGGGDQFALVVASGRDDVFVWEHETDSRVWVAGGLQEYLRRALAGDGDWWR